MRIVKSIVLLWFLWLTVGASLQDKQSTCKFTADAKGKTSKIQYFIGQRVDLNSSELHMRVYKENRTGNVLQCDRRHADGEAECESILAGVESKGLVDRVLTLEFPNLTNVLQGTYTLLLIVNSTSLAPVSCTINIAQIIKEDSRAAESESGKSDHLITTIVPTVLSIACLAFVILYLLRKKGRLTCPFGRGNTNEAALKANPSTEAFSTTTNTRCGVRDEADNPDIDTSPLRRVGSIKKVFDPRNDEGSALVQTDNVSTSPNDRESGGMTSGAEFDVA
ncbi:uncharacterized protein [Littorina saxatilis]|uniref:uncharacterized protein n=1 Tax=Littorina saxatilis TaxID=31220 RepID=UPI0038B4DB4F